jgi:hypothetical protein
MIRGWHRTHPPLAGEPHPDRKARALPSPSKLTRMPPTRYPLASESRTGRRTRPPQARGPRAGCHRTDQRGEVSTCTWVHRVELHRLVRFRSADDLAAEHVVAPGLVLPDGQVLGGGVPGGDAQLGIDETTPTRPARRRVRPADVSRSGADRPAPRRRPGRGRRTPPTAVPAVRRAGPRRRPRRHSPRVPGGGTRPRARSARSAGRQT